MPDPDDLLLLAAALFLTALGGLFAASTAAIFRLGRDEVDDMVEERLFGARSLRRVLDDPGPHANVLAFLRIITEMAAAVCVTLVLADSFASPWAALVVSTAAMAVVSFVLVGVSPRAIGQEHAPAVARFTAPLAHAATRALGWLARLLVWFGNAVTPGREPGARPVAPFVSEGHLRDLVEQAGASDVLEDDERAMIQSVFDFRDTEVHEVMVPRPDVVTIGADTALDDALEVFLRSGFSRIPVTGADDDDVRGILNFKDAVARLHRDPEQAVGMPVLQLVRPAYFVPDSKDVADLLQEMQRGSVHLAMVVDEYGGTAGLVTIEDLIEEIVGEISDEYDRDRKLVERVDERTWRVGVRLPVDDLAELAGVELDEEDVDTVGGLFAKALGKVPIAGSAAAVGGLHLEAERIGGRRKQLTTVLVRREDDAAIPATDHTERQEHRA